jgi:hypothetical protein
MITTTATHREQAARIVRSLQVREPHLRVLALMGRVDAAILGDDAALAQAWRDVEAEVKRWAATAKAACEGLQSELAGIEAVERACGRAVALYDLPLAHRLATEGKSMHADSIGYWPEVYRQLCSNAGRVAAAAGFNINSRLGRVIY